MRNYSQVIIITFSSVSINYLCKHLHDCCDFIAELESFSLYNCSKSVNDKETKEYHVLIIKILVKYLKS